MATDGAKYSKDEKVLCKHGLCFYPAKILDVEVSDEPDDKGFKYFVHYQGWNPKWDEWVQDDRLDKYTEERAKAAAEEQRKIQEQMRKKKSSSHGGGGSSKSSTKAQSESDRASVTSSVADQAPLKDVDAGVGGGSRGSSPSVESTVSSSATGAASVGAANSANGNTGLLPSRKSRGKSSVATAKTSLQSSCDVRGSAPTATESAPSSTSGVQPTSDSKRRRIRTSDVSSSSSKQTNASHSTANQTQTNQSSTSSCVQSEQDYLTKPEVCIKVPEDLRPLLVDDWDLVVQQMKLVHLPSNLTVAQIFRDYVQEKRNLRNLSPIKLSQFVESAEGLCAYFDVMLPTLLLYKFEKPQYDELYQKNPDLLASEFYGYIHLLRLFVRLGHMLTCTALDDKNISIIVSGVTEFLKYMKKIKPQHLASDYETAPPEYQRIAYS